MNLQKRNGKNISMMIFLLQDIVETRIVMRADEEKYHILLELNGATVVQVHILYHITSLIGADLLRG